MPLNLKKEPRSHNSVSDDISGSKIIDQTRTVGAQTKMRRTKRTRVTDNQHQQCLPHTVLVAIMEAMVAQLEPDGVIGPSIIVVWLAKAALVRSNVYLLLSVQLAVAPTAQHSTARVHACVQ